jgi:hypothetical protein
VPVCRLNPRILHGVRRAALERRRRVSSLGSFIRTAVADRAIARSEWPGGRSRTRQRPCAVIGSSGRLSSSLGFQPEVHGHRRAEYIEYRTVRVDHILQFCEFGIWRTAFQINDAPHIVEAGAYTVFNGEEAAQIERSFKRDGNAFERNAKRGGVGPVSNFLTCG